VKHSLKGWILFCILSTAALAFGQNATTSLRGIIKDPNGALVPGAKITLTNNADGQTLSAVANSAGEYVFAQVTPARYTITATAAGFGDQIKTAELLVSQPATIDFILSVQSSTVTVDVSAAAQTLNTTDASLGGSADNALIQALPSETRNVPDLLSLQPGVLYLPNAQDSRSGAVNGSRSDQGNVTLDGVDDNDQVNGFAFTGVLRETQDSIEEFRVTTGDANSDAGRSSGAQISMLTKSGTNKFHGAAYEYNRPTITVANNWFNKQAEVDSGEPNIPGKLIRNIFGGALGGPILKDKLFFFGNYEGSRLAENTQVSQTDPTASYQAGILSYIDNSGNTQVLSPAQVAALDAGCQVCGTAAYPSAPGPNPAALAYFNSMPAANGSNLGDGINEGSYSFSSPNPIRLNTTIGRIDYTPNDRHRIFVRGNLQDDNTQATEQFPGQGPQSVTQDNSKGITAGETWSIRSNLINDFRYGYVRQGFDNRGVGSGDYVDFRFLSMTTAETRTTITSVPVNNIIDNLNWTKGNHAIQFGGNWRLIHQNQGEDTFTFQNASTNPYWLATESGGVSLVPQPASGVNGGFSNSYEIAFSNLVGTVPSLTNSYNYKVTSATSGSLLPDGAFLNRAFKANEYEWYIQDAWRVRPNLTVTFGVRHTILQTPWETSGQQVAPTVDTHAWYLARESAAQAGQVNEPNLEFAPTGPFYNKPGFWPKSKDNFAPRLAIAYSPNGKTSIRAGAGIYYDHYGESLVNTFNTQGSFGISALITNPASSYSIDGTSSLPASPRFTGRSNLPAINNGVPQNPQTYPYSPPSGPADGFAITWGLDNHLKTPYSESFDFSVQNELPGGFTLETSYVGRLGRHLLQQLDLAEPVDYVDPQGGGDYYAAGTQLARLVDANGGNPNASVPAIPYFEDIFPFMAGHDFAGESATQAVYTNEFAPNRAGLGETNSLADIDFFCLYGCPGGYVSKFWQQQFSSLYALDTIGMSYYNAGQITLRHPMSHGLQMDLSYTYSRSIDFGSDSERSTELTGPTTTNGTPSLSFSDILNTWKPYLNRAVSDFDTTHLITGDWVYQMPFGRGQALLGNANHLLDAVAGGWQLSGIARWSSGLPFSLSEPGFTTDWQSESFAVETQPVKMRRHFDQNGNPQFFDNPDAINNGVATGGPVRLPYPGEAGERNFFRGDGYFDLDSGLNKSWKLERYGTLKFGWEVYNVTNAVRFDPSSITGGLTSADLGIASSLLTQGRRMQFSLRYDF
jgi:hypothetical protein